jgi:hypothetical protein
MPVIESLPEPVIERSRDGVEGEPRCRHFNQLRPSFGTEVEGDVRFPAYPALGIGWKITL